MQAREKDERWVLAFDGACSACTAISAAVAEASEGKLEVTPLANAEVDQWRQQVMGPEPKWEPTLLRVRGQEGRQEVRVWTGPLMTPPLARRLGPRTTVRVLRALGRIREAAKQNDPVAVQEEGGAESGIGRKRFLQLCGGIGVAAGLTLAGQTPAFAQSEASRARAWVAANKARLPGTYDEIVRHSIPYRKAILRAKSPQEKAQLWVEQVRRYRAAHPDLSREQTAVLDEAVEVIPRYFPSGSKESGRSVRLEDAAKAAFGKEEAGALFARFGPADTRSRPTPYCVCATDSDYCNHGSCHGGGCNIVEDECGWLYTHHCDGLCE